MPRKHIKFRCKRGEGREAVLILGRENVFPGIGGTIKTGEAVPVGIREERKLEPKRGHRIFLYQLLAKKLDDYHFRRGIYHFSHIPRPLGSTSQQGEKPYEASFYEWATGSEGFSWKDRGGMPLVLKDWDKFRKHFDQAGINLWESTNCGDDRSKDIIHECPGSRREDEPFTLSCMWKRIDFGPESISIDWEKLSRFLVERRWSLSILLRPDRYKMIQLAVKYLTGDTITAWEVGKLEKFIGEYRFASIEHLARSVGSVAELSFLGEEETLLLNKSWPQRIRDFLFRK